MSTSLRFGVQPITYSLTWDEALTAARRVDELGFDDLWGHDHLFSTGGDIHQPFFEGWTTLAAWAAVTSHVRLGVLVTANPFRNPGVVAKMAATVDHISGGRLVLGMGAGNRELETTAHGLDETRSVGQRLDRLDEALTVVRALLDGEVVTHAGPTYHLEAVRHAPPPIQRHVPIVIGASGEKKGLRIVARHADIWQVFVGPHDTDALRHKDTVLREHCGAIGRDPSAISRTVGGKLVLRATEGEARAAWDLQKQVHGWAEPYWEQMAWVGTSEQVADWARGHVAAGADAFCFSVAAPLDLETIERFATEVRPRVADVAGG